jgi:hypothetical protein
MIMIRKLRVILVKCGFILFYLLKCYSCCFSNRDSLTVTSLEKEDTMEVKDDLVESKEDPMESMSVVDAADTMESESVDEVADSPESKVDFLQSKEESMESKADSLANKADPLQSMSVIEDGKSVISVEEAEKKE